ncbi:MULTISPECIES: hypothetical protein [unclassified Pseudonocardia]|uniref:hypothetical protein n=1 Tax=unclassified Pseudonocardia TaxID=2619320 RepID=UPI0001FFE4B1|nr:hypothetical protein [Pseudonocardia sp. Ae707_Ps1]OLM16741.1 hypothetical protein Ae707Ps1_0999 [Pseudonocardia sp. Ae707_Ps1]
MVVFLLLAVGVVLVIVRLWAGEVVASVIALAVAVAAGVLVLAPVLRSRSGSTVPAALAGLPGIRDEDRVVEDGCPAPSDRTEPGPALADGGEAPGGPSSDGKRVSITGTSAPEAVVEQAVAFVRIDAGDAPDELSPDDAAHAVVHVVPGRRRYHRDGCTLLESVEAETITLADANDEHFSACTRCHV